MTDENLSERDKAMARFAMESGLEHAAAIAELLAAQFDGKKMIDGAMALRAFANAIRSRNKDFFPAPR